MKNKLEKMFLDYANNYLTVSKFAEAYNITAKKANRILDVGRKVHYKKIGGVKND